MRTSLPLVALVIALSWSLGLMITAGVAAFGALCLAVARDFLERAETSSDDDALDVGGSCDA